MHLPDEVVSLMREHPYKCWLAVLQPHEADDFDAVARTAGIEPLEKRWHEVERGRAEQFLTGLLHRSLAYNAELMPRKTAAWLAAQFLDAVGQHTTRFATNSTDLPDALPFSWDPATDHTIDAGIVAIGSDGSALYWVADED
jgi:hypothetical protein